MLRESMKPVNERMEERLKERKEEKEEGVFMDMCGSILYFKRCV